MILVIGSTGKLGNEICHLLKEKNIPARAMIRKTTPDEKRNELTKLGLQLVEGDLCDNSNFAEVLQGVTTVITTVSSMPFAYAPGENDIAKVDEEGMINLIDAAKQADVKHFIYTSFSGNLDLDFPLRNAKRKVENHLQQSGMTYTILRPGFFMEVWLSAMVGFDVLNGKVNLCGSGTNPVAFISLKDVAKFAVECLTNPKAKNAILELGGPENIKPLDIVKTFEEVLGKKIEIRNIPEADLQGQLAGATEPMQKSFAGLMCCMAIGDKIDMGETLKKFPVKMITVRELAQKSI
jgi:uncharacterized protein YbjT (DUF2867 family)